MGNSEPAFPNGPSVSGSADSYYHDDLARPLFLMPLATCHLAQRGLGSCSNLPCEELSFHSHSFCVCVCVCVEPVFLQLRTDQNLNVSGQNGHLGNRPCLGGRRRVEVRQTRASEISPSRIVIVPRENTHLWHFVSHCLPLLQCRVAPASSQLQPCPERRPLFLFFFSF